MNFFSKLSEFDIDEFTIKVNFKNKDFSTVIIVPNCQVNDPAIQQIKPLSITGKINEIDSNFFELITKPFDQTAKLINSVKSYEAKLQEIEKSTALAKEISKKIQSAKTKIEKIINEQNFNAAAPNPKLKKLIEDLLQLDPINKFALDTKTLLIKANSTLKLNV